MECHLLALEEMIPGRWPEEWGSVFSFQFSPQFKVVFSILICLSGELALKITLLILVMNFQKLSSDVLPSLSFN